MSDAERRSDSDLNLICARGFVLFEAERRLNFGLNFEKYDAYLTQILHVYLYIMNKDTLFNTKHMNSTSR